MPLLSRSNVISRVKVPIHPPDDLGHDVRFMHILFPFWVEFSLSHERLLSRWRMIMFLGLLHGNAFYLQPYLMLIVGFSFAAIIRIFSMYVLGVGSSQSKFSLC